MGGEKKDMKILLAHARELWNKWELRMLILLSLTWQVTLIIFGSRRKYAGGSLISFLVWVAYLSADWLATVSLGILARTQGSGTNVVLQALWAPFLLLHLGGPDTITAYSLEDNSLWLRHLLGLVIQVTVAFYVYLRSWSSNPLTFVAIPVFISGVIKYIERTLALRSASPVQFEDSLLSAPTPQAPDLKHILADSELEFVHQGYSLFSMLKRLYANLSLRFAEGQRSYSLIVKKKRSKEIIDVRQQQSYYAFKLVEVQLGFLYDMLYTKAPIIYSLPGLVFRFISFFSIASALAAFAIFVEPNDHSRLDICMTFALFIGAISLELYAFVSLFFSDWTMRWLTKNGGPLQNFINWALCHGQKRWSGCLAQHNLMSFCMKKRVARWIGSDLLFRFCFSLELYWQRTWKRVDKDLKELIFQQLLKKHKKYDDSGFKYKDLKQLLQYKGNHVLSNPHNNCLDEIGWSVEVEFGHSLLIWHVATDICYYSTPDKDKNNECKASKMLSDYMLYVLLMRPFLLPKWIDRITRVRDSFREAIRILQRRQFPIKDGANASRMLIQMYKQSHQPLEQLRKEKSDKSVLLDGCHLASQLQDLGCSKDLGCLWEMICQVWIEMLTYAASQCEWGSHAQQLRRGGELLTHVCLLMADLGLNEQFDIGRRGPPIESQNEGWGWVKCNILDPYK